MIMHISSFYLHKQPSFIDEEAEAEKLYITCPRLALLGSGLELQQSPSRAYTLSWRSAFLVGIWSVGNRMSERPSNLSEVTSPALHRAGCDSGNLAACFWFKAWTWKLSGRKVSRSRNHQVANPTRPKFLSQAEVEISGCSVLILLPSTSPVPVLFWNPVPLLFQKVLYRRLTRLLSAYIVYCQNFSQCSFFALACVLETVFLLYPWTFTTYLLCVNTLLFRARHCANKCFTGSISFYLYDNPLSKGRKTFSFYSWEAWVMEN